MNIQDYISSGIVESYVLGLASDEEKAEFERVCSSHSEVRMAREEFELSLEKHARTNSLEPPVGVKEKIFSDLDLSTATGKNGFGQAGVPVATPAPVIHLNRWRYIAAALVVLLVSSVVLNVYFFGRYKSYSSRYDLLLAQQTQLTDNNKVLQTKLQTYRNSLSTISDTGMVVIKMAGSNVPTSPDPQSLATIYWNSRSKDVYLLVNNMPAPADGKQYQLWAIVDGKPVSEGVFDVGQESRLVKMKNIAHAQAFAVTLEKAGGSPTPTLRNMYVLGKVV